jgi:hypothetical protein
MQQEQEQEEKGRVGRWGRIALAVALALGWAIAVPFMWKAVTTVPSAARLQEMQSKILHVPTPATFLRTGLQSLAELAVLVALLWPWWRRLWLTRLALAFLALAVWAVATMPLEQTSLELVHYRWMVGADLLLLAAFVASVIARLAAAFRAGRS